MLRTPNTKVALALAFALLFCRAMPRLAPASEVASSPEKPGSTASNRAASNDRAPASPLGLAMANLQRAESARRNSDPRCVTFYAKAALQSWSEIRPPSGTAQSDDVASTAWNLYHHSVANLIRNAAKHGQLDTRRGISLVTDEGRAHIDIARHEFPWRQDDFTELQVVRQADRNALARHWFDPGLGVPLVVHRHRPESKEYLGKAVPFAATAILRPTRRVAAKMESQQAASSAAPRKVGTLELYDPLRVAHVDAGHQVFALARDLSAPLVVASEEVDRDNIQNFLRPGRFDEGAGLRMIEPYQPGKIPVVFVHGLLSDKVTWIDLVNDLRAVPWFSHRYQIWAFQYRTGQSFLRSAAEMRKALNEALWHFDPQETDAALSHIVLVGHSMGGIVSKLQISSSHDTLWESVAHRPVDEINTTPKNRAAIRSLFFFDPLPSIRRVVFIGSPHQGSQLALGWLGRIGAKLVRSPRERTTMLHSLLKSNPGVFVDQVRKRVPTSVDLLRPGNPILVATYDLPVSEKVHLHTIIGTGKKLKDGTPADGVVPVESARHPGTVSERYVEATHTELHHHPDTTAEVVRILSEHLRGYYVAKQERRARLGVTAADSRMELSSRDFGGRHQSGHVRR